MYQSLRFIGILLLLTACGPSESRPEDALGTGRLFLRQVLDGDMKEARSLLYQDEANLSAFDQFTRKTDSLVSDSKKQASKKADIIIHSVDELNDSVTVIYYSSSLQKQKKPLRLLRKDKIWQVDFYYTQSGNL